MLTEFSNTFVVAMGISIVFIGLICIVLLCKIVSAICMIANKKENATPVTTSVSTAPASNEQPIENRQEIIAAISAVLAEELGTDVSALRILSFKKN